MTTATLAAPAPMVVEEPGVYAEIPELVYHADPVPEGSLSFSGAKKLLPPSAPALFKWDRDNGQAPKRQFDFGHAAHAEVLGVGLDLAVIPGERWDTKAAKEAVAEARARGAVPLKESELATVKAMAAALREHPLARALLTPAGGIAEASMFWRDSENAVMRRCRVDWLNTTPGVDRLILTDYKSTVCADPETFGRNGATYGYPQQADWYCDGARTLGLADDVVMVFIAQEKTPPYLVSVVEYDDEALRRAREINRRAIELFAHCMTEDHWPGYSPHTVDLVSAPRWYFYDRQDVA